MFLLGILSTNIFDYFSFLRETEGARWIRNSVTRDLQFLCFRFGTKVRLELSANIFLKSVAFFPRFSFHTAAFFVFPMKSFLTVWVRSRAIALFRFCVEKCQCIWTLRVTDGILHFISMFSGILIKQNSKYLWTNNIYKLTLITQTVKLAKILRSNLTAIFLVGIFARWNANEMENLNLIILSRVLSISRYFPTTLKYRERQIEIHNLFSSRQVRIENKQEYLEISKTPKK